MLFQHYRAISLFLLPLLFCLSVEAAPAKKKPPAPLNLGAAAQGVTVNLPDPKLPGKMMLEVRAREAFGQSADNGFLGRMTHVWARLYQKGVPAAILTAPNVQGSSLKKTIVVTATGGVVIKSLTQPGTKLSADQVVWYASVNKIVATGHVIYHDGKTGATMTGPQALADTNLKTLQIVSGHVSALL